MKLLLATDGSLYSNAALEEIANSPYPPESSVHVISIINNVVLARGNAPMGAVNKFYAESGRMAMEKAKENIEDAERVLQMKTPALSVSTAIINGSPKSVILQEAEKLEVDLIIVGSHGYGPVKRFVLGSVSQAVALHAKCSVRIVKIKNKE